MIYFNFKEMKGEKNRSNVDKALPDQINLMISFKPT